MGKKAFCSKCKYWRSSSTVYGDCIHPSNIVKTKNYFKEKEVAVKSPPVLNGDNKCENYEYSLVRGIVNALFVHGQ